MRVSINGKSKKNRSSTYSQKGSRVLSMINTMHAAGRLTRDPIKKVLPSGTFVVNFSLALNRRYKGKDGVYVDEVCYLDAEAWGTFVDTVSKYLRLGSMVYVSGRLKQDTWTDKDSGQKRSKIKLVVEDLKLFPKIGEEQRRHNDESTSDDSSGRIVPLDEVSNGNGEPVHENSSSNSSSEEPIPF